MSTVTVRIKKEFADTAKIAGNASKRSINNQVEYWALVGKIAEENHDLTYPAIKGILQGLAEDEAGKTTPFTFTHRRAV